MHVCVTFLPKNQRVQDQAFGRSARKGNKGTWQMVVIKQAVQMLLQKFVSEDTDIIKLRDDKENSLQKRSKE